MPRTFGTVRNNFSLNLSPAIYPYTIPTNYCAQCELYGNLFFQNASRKQRDMRLNDKGNFLHAYICLLFQLKIRIIENQKFINNLDYLFHFSGKWQNVVCHLLTDISSDILYIALSLTVDNSENLINFAYGKIKMSTP